MSKPLGEQLAKDEDPGTGAQGSEGPVGGEAGKQAADDKKGDDAGFPADTPWREMTLGQQVEYWKAQSRKHEQGVKSMSDYDDLKTKAAEYQKLVEASKTEQEKAIDAAAKEAREATLKEVGSRLVDAQFTVAAAGRLDGDRLSALLDGVDRTRFMKDDGSADADKVKAFVDSVAPAQKQQEQRHDFGQGSRQGSTVPSVEAGFAEYQRMHPQTTSS
jgi:hypothetical protein